jgi:hypothetical protein
MPLEPLDAPLELPLEPPPSAGPESGGPASGQHCAAGWPQSSTQLPEQPVGAQHVFAEVHTSPGGQIVDGQETDCPQLLTTVTLH